MINLFDTYHQESRDLHQSLQAAGYHHPTIVLHDDGFLPADVTSPYAYFMGVEKGKPRYFNKIELPPYWEITGTAEMGEIRNLEEKQAEIIYAPPGQKRLVREVRWLDKQKGIRLVDHYNQYGRKFAQTIYNLNREVILTSYFTTENKEVIVENYVTGDIILNLKNRIKIFQSKTEFVKFFLEYAGYDVDHIFYNSLSTPFFVSHTLTKKGQDLLFWQETSQEQIPGNMLTILEGKSPRTQEVLIQNRDVYHRFRSQLAPQLQGKLSFLGYSYPFKQENPLNHHAFILTNSDQLEEIDHLIEQLPFVEFHIAALTEMSTSLTARDKYPNVHLYPRSEETTIRRLLEQSSVYLDINHHGEVLSIVRQAFEHRLLIAGFQTTAHHLSLTNPDFLFPKEGVQDLIQFLKDVFEQPSHLLVALEQQKMRANFSGVKEYQERLGRQFSS